MSDYISTLAKCQQKKVLSRRMANKLWIVDHSLAVKILSCGSNLAFDADGRIVAADFCRSRWCSMCQWRRTLKLYSQNCSVWGRLNELYSPRWVFLTLTVPNVPAEELSITFRAMSHAWRLLSKDRSYLSLGVLGGLRTVECTYNSSRNDFHPHYHVLMAVSDGVWLPDQSWWLQLWQRCCCNPNIKMVDIRSVKGSPIRELSKYVVKSSDFLTGLGWLDDWDLVKLAFQHVRCFCPFGVWRTARRDLGFTLDPELEPLTDDSSHAPVVEACWDDILMTYSVLGLH